MTRSHQQSYENKFVDNINQIKPIFLPILDYYSSNYMDYIDQFKPASFIPLSQFTHKQHISYFFQVQFYA